jgi:hypothetical protein
MEPNHKVVGVAVGVIAVAGVALLASNPLRRSDDSIHRWLLKNVPIGSDLATLQAVAKRKGWRINGTWQGHQPHSDWGGIDGDTVAWIYLGGYRSVLVTDIDSFWAFDEGGKLLDVHTRRMTDGP